MVSRLDADRNPFVLKKDGSGNIMRTRVSGQAGGELLASIQKTNEGLSYLVAGSGITVSSGTNGQVVIAAVGGGSGAPTDATYVVITNDPTLTNERALTAGSGISITDNGPNSTVVIAATGGSSAPTNAEYVVLALNGTLTQERVLTPGVGLTLTDGGANGNATLDVNDSIIATLSGSRFHANITVVGTGSFEGGISGSLTRLVDGRSYLAAGSNITIASASNGQVVISAAASSPTAGDGIFIAGSQVNVDGTVARVSGSHFTGGITVVGTGSFEGGLSGSLTRLTDGTSFMAGQGSVLVSSVSNGQITISGSGITTLQAGDGVFIVPGSQPSISVNGTVARISGSHFTGGITVVGTGSFEAGISGSLTRLTDGTSYLLPGTNIQISSASNGAITISTSPTILSGTGDPNAQYVLMTLTGSVPNGRKLTAGAGITITDGGANANVIIATALSQFVELAPDTNNVSGTTETVVGSMRIPSGTYAVGHAMLGNMTANDTATFRLRQFSQVAGSGQGNIILTLTGTGILNDVPSTGSVVLPTTGFYDFSLSCSSTSGTAIFLGGELSL